MTRSLPLLAAALALSACAARQPVGQPQRLGDLYWRACPWSQATEVVNGSDEAIRVWAGEGQTGSPRPQPARWQGTIARGATEVFEMVERTANYLYVAPADRSYDANGGIRRPLGYQRIQISCVGKSGD
jgi:hypothetical protein